MTDREPPTIEHIPGERRVGNGILWAAWIMIGLLWAASLYEGGIHWDDVMLGVATGGVILGWAIEITGNKVPASWARKAPRR